MDTTAEFKSEILGLEKQYWASMRDQDLDMALSLTDFPCLVVGHRGAMPVEKEQFVEMFNGNAGMVRDFEIDDSKASVRLIAPDTAIVAYSVKSNFGKGDAAKTINAADTSTWVKRDGKWVCSMHTETEIQQH